MYAIVEIAGQQFKIQKDRKLYVNRLKAEEGSEFQVSNVLLAEKDGKATIGKDELSKIKITAKVISHVRGDKVLVFKKKRRKGYQKMNGHRQDLSQIQIIDIA